MSVNAHHEPWEVSSALHAEGTDEEVEDCGDEDYAGHDVVRVIQTCLQGGVIQVPTACDTHTGTQQRKRGFKPHLVSLTWMYQVECRL